MVIVYCTCRFFFSFFFHSLYQSFRSKICSFWGDRYYVTCLVREGIKCRQAGDSVSTATENVSRLGYKHICVNYLHVASHDYDSYEKVIQHTDSETHTSTHSLTESLTELFYFFSLNSRLSFNTNSNIIESET